MKRILLFLCAVMLLSSCGQKTTAPLVMPSAAETGGGEAAETETIERASETLPFYAARSSCYADRTLYSTRGGLLTYTPLEKGEARPLCFDPLCAHESAVDCPARIGVESGVIVADGAVYTVALCVKNAAVTPYEWVYQLRVMDVASGKVRVLYERQDPIDDFWLLGDALYLSVPFSKETTTDAGGTHTRYGGMSIARVEKNGSLTVVLEDPDGMYPALLASDNGAIYYTGKYGGTPIFAADYGFGKSVAVFEAEGRAYDYEIWDDCLYYIRWTDRHIDDPSEVIEGDFDPDVSVTGHGAYVCELVRRRIGEEAEVLSDTVPLPGFDGPRERQLYQIDREAGILFYVPLDFSYQGAVIWEFSAEEKTLLVQMGNFHDKPILTKKYSSTGGRLVRLDLATMERCDVLTDSGSDIVDLFAVEEGRVWARFERYDVEDIKTRMAAGEKTGDSMLSFAYLSFKEIES